MFETSYPSCKQNKQNSFLTRNRELTRLAHTSTKLKFEVIVKFIGLSPHSIQTSTRIKHRCFLSSFVVTSSHSASTDEPPFDHQGGSKFFHNPICGLNYKS